MLKHVRTQENVLKAKNNIDTIFINTKCSRALPEIPIIVESFGSQSQVHFFDGE